MKVKPVPVKLVAQTCLEMAAIKEPAHDKLLIDTLVKFYHQEPPVPSLEAYRQGLRAGIRIALLATGQRVPGIDLEGGESK
ncbi:hypothetical protein A0U40_05395 [[Bacillus] sp. KCTC 13219]|nr:hypothetical protein A0U40_05395 [[Bacillus] sp. KCTC 13219]